VAPRDLEPEVWEDYVSSYENGRFAESTRYVRSYPEQLLVLRDPLPAIRVPVHVFAAADDPLVPVSNGQYLADRISGSKLTILPAGHFAWEEVPDQFAALVTDWVTRKELSS
jgi:pimeloyl-ACP methyl ester carboxylesterase